MRSNEDVISSAYALVPGPAHTDMTEHLYLDREWRAAMLERTPIARLGQPGDLHGAALFLLSDASRFVTGVCLPADGGILASLRVCTERRRPLAPG